MGVFILDMKHVPDRCPMFNEGVRKIFLEKSDKMEEIAGKLDIKVLVNVAVTIEHNIIMVLEAPSVEAVENFVMEMEFASFNIVNLRHAQTNEDILEKLSSG